VSHRRCVIGDDIGRQCAGRQHAEDGGGVRGGFGDGAIDVGAWMEEDLDDRDAVERLRLDVLDVVDVRRQCAFIDGGDAVRHVLGREAVERPHDADHWNIDVRKDIRRGAHDCERAEDEQQDRDDDKGVGPVQGESDDPHGGFQDGGAAEGPQGFVMETVCGCGTYPKVTGRLRLRYVGEWRAG
jgi:hypothetical protein